MRIISDDVKPYNIILSGDNSKSKMYFESGTIEITDEEWEKILSGYCQYDCSTIKLPVDVKPTFAQYLRELIELKKNKFVRFDNWMPIFPCSDCNKEQEHFYDLENYCCCDDKNNYVHEIEGQKKLMRWLVSGDNFVTITGAMRDEIYSMIRELDDLDDKNSWCDSSCELYDGRVCDVASNCNRRQQWKKELKGL